LNVFALRATRVFFDNSRGRSGFKILLLLIGWRILAEIQLLVATCSFNHDSFQIKPTILDPSHTTDCDDLRSFYRTVGNIATNRQDGF
jgi:hypothetical protein